MTAAGSGGLAGPPLRLREHDLAVILGSCYDAGEEEACGLLVGPYGAGGAPTGEVRAVYPCRNVDASALTYTVDPADFLRVSNRAEEQGDEIVGVWHSHTHTDAYPSATDVERAVDPTWFYVIVSLEPGDAPTLRAYRIRDGRRTEVPVVVERDAPGMSTT